MKGLLTVLMSACLVTTASAGVFLITDGGSGNPYGDTGGFVVDIDTAFNSRWSEPLVAGQQYRIVSISIWEASDAKNPADATPVYLAVFDTFAGFDGDTSAEYLVHSDNAINHTLTPDTTKITYYFTDLIVTAGNDGWVNDGLLYFLWDNDRTRNNFQASGGVHPYQRIDSNPAASGYGAAVYAFGAIQSARVPEIEITVAPLIAPGAPYDPMAIPQNDDGTVGTVDMADLKVKDVDLTFKAGKDPNAVRGLLVNPDIEGFYVYFQKNAPTDPNLYYIDWLDKGSQTDPNRIFYLSGYPEVILNQGTTYKWQVEEAIKNPAGDFYGIGDPNNIVGPVWSFSTANAIPTITAKTPYHTLTDFAGNGTLTVTASITADHFQWFKVVGVRDAQGGETDDVLLSDTTIAGVTYSGTGTATLGLNGMASDGSEDAQYYAIAYNGVPGGAQSQASTPSDVAWVWYPRLVNRFTFESMTGGVVTDMVSGYTMTVNTNDVGLDVPVLTSNVPSAPGISGNASSLKFDNPRGTDPNSADAQYAQVTEGWAGGYKDITISAWVYNSGGSNWNRILDFGSGQNNNMFICLNPGSVNNAVRFAVKVNGTEQSITTAADKLPLNQWTHVTATLTGSTGRIYINGELSVTSTTMSNDPVSYGPSTQNWLARSQYGANDGYFNGSIDELKIYNYALTTVEVADSYMADSQKDWVCDFERNPNYGTLVYDLNKNCIVDLADLAIFAGTWLDSYRFYRE